MMMISVGLSFSGASLHVSRFTHVDQPEGLHRSGTPRTIGYMFFSFSCGDGTSCIGSHRRMFQGEPDDEDGTEANTEAVREYHKDGEITRMMRPRFGETKGGQVQDSEVPGDPCLVLLFDFPCSCQVRHTTCPFQTGLFDAQYISDSEDAAHFFGRSSTARQYADIAERSGCEFGDGHARRSNFVALLSRWCQRIARTIIHKPLIQIPSTS
ncbi:hypothetical protein EDB92DRAFT_1906240 [Lactarius akahatsu]|uniref:Uncharacterized protein n=1 Tax=Lactarius akahatsu TaxID=416441 RepID=A0AAD4Q849_9AGAM|nr:hypothetical protein EDB92DRAFT_1906240 [Lactarius akahatsu]